VGKFKGLKQVAIKLQLLEHFLFLLVQHMIM